MNFQRKIQMNLKFVDVNFLESSSLSLDKLIKFTTKYSLVEGTNNSEIIIGSNGDNQILAFSGDDNITASKGNDIIFIMDSKIG